MPEFSTIMKLHPVKIYAITLAFLLLGLSRGFACDSFTHSQQNTDAKENLTKSTVKESAYYILSVEAELSQGNEEIPVFQDAGSFSHSSFYCRSYPSYYLTNTKSSFYKSSNIALFILDCALIL